MSGVTKKQEEFIPTNKSQVLQDAVLIILMASGSPVEPLDAIGRTLRFHGTTV